MPRIDSHGVGLDYIDVEPRSGEGAGTVVLSHSYLVDRRQFDSQVEALSQHHRVIAYDHRDHGHSDRVSASYSLDDLIADAVNVIEKTAAAPCHWIGLSTGGFVGARLALRRPDLLRSLVLMDSSGQRESPLKRAKYRAMFLALRIVGTGPLRSQALRSMFGRTVFEDPSRRPMLDLWSERITANDPQALIRFGTAIFARDDVLERLTSIDLPVLVVVGAEDRALPPHLSRALAEAIPNARLEIIDGAGHLCTLEQPERVNELLVCFVAQTEKPKS